MQTKLPLNGTIQHPDLAEALRGENGTFFCQQGGQGYIVTAAEGFSIKSLRPVGRKIGGGQCAHDGGSGTLGDYQNLRGRS